MMIKHTEFGKTKRVRAQCYNMNDDEKHDIVLWCERGEDMYALSSPQYKGKKVAIVHRNDWLKAKEVDG